ncbi:MAG: LPS-assembly protein LptD [Chthonomonadetes bacterium]|nr:LPS-assembly protein LptD [Chthonomonadetes bacterium]
MDPSPGGQFGIACPPRWLIALALVVALGCGRAWSAPPPTDQETWRLLARRVESRGFTYFVAEGDAEVQWGNRRVRAQRIEGDTETGWITATGDVLFEDERGRLYASQTRVNLKTREGDLADVRGTIEGIIITADTLHSDGSTLDMHNVTLTTCERNPPDFLLSARSLSLSSALRIRARHVSLSAWGNRLISVPYLSRRIGRREPGEPLIPQIGYSRRRGLMVYYGDLLPQQWAQVRYSLRVFTRHDPEIRLDLLRRLDGDSDAEPLRHLEPTERPGVSFLETITAHGWLATEESRSKQGAFLSLRANSPVENLERTDLYLRGVELGYQTAQPLAGGTLETEWKAGRLRESPTLVTANRAVALVRWQSPTLTIGNRLATDLTLDARAGVYPEEAYSWARAQWGLYWQANTAVQMGAGVALATTRGSSPFVFDQLETRREARFRLRLTGHWGVDVLGKWDMEQRRWRDWQVAITLPAHCVQPQILWSSQQRQLQIQLSLVSR